MDSSQPIVLARQQESSWALRWSRDTNSTGAKRRIKGVLFTLAGIELFAAVEEIPNPQYTTAMLKTLEQDGWTPIPIPNES